ncbi:MAG: hypothetical protein GYA50_01325 [Eubacteriaceae bacterium]|nr:hypothetical protein [Eubacteriaceae bacterium]
MADIKGKYLKRIRRRNAIKVAIIITVFLAGVLILFLSREKTMLLESQNYIISSDVKALFIKNEAVMYFGHDIVAVENEGAKVSKNTILAKELDSTAYYNYEKQIIQNKLDNYMYDDKTKFFSDIKDSVGKKDGELTLGTVKYLFYTENQLNTLYNKYSNMQKSSELKLINTPINFTGQVYYKTDGYEDIAPMSVLSMLSPDYLDYVFNIKESKLTVRNSMVVKVKDNSCVFVNFELPKATTIDFENTAMNYKEKIMTQNSLQYNDYFTFLKKRMDVLQQYPQMYFQIGDKTLAGYIVDIKEFEKSKIITLCVSKDVEDLMNARISDIKVQTQRYANVFKIPKNSVYKNSSEQDCIDIIDKGKIKKTYAVTIRGYDESGSYALIDVKGILLTSQDSNNTQNSSENLEDCSLLIK